MVTATPSALSCAVHSGMTVDSPISSMTADPESAAHDEDADEKVVAKKQPKVLLHVTVNSSPGAGKLSISK
jgi:hypothetical protein